MVAGREMQHHLHHHLHPFQHQHPQTTSSGHEQQKGDEELGEGHCETCGPCVQTELEQGWPEGVGAGRHPSPWTSATSFLSSFLQLVGPSAIGVQ